MNLDGIRPSASLEPFFRSLSVLYKAGIRIDRALMYAGGQSDDRRLADVSRAMVADVNRGRPLSQAMGQWPVLFGPLHVQLTKVGETTGKLGQVLDGLAAYEGRRREIQLRLASALTYPLFIFALSLVSLAIVPPMLFRGLLGTLEKSGVALPLPTRGLLLLTRLLHSPWLWLALGVAVTMAAWFLPRYLRRPSVRLALFKRMLRLPALGPVIRLATVIRVARSLELMLSTGIHVDQSLKMAFESADNPVLERRLPRVLEAMRSGSSLRKSLAQADFFPPAFLHMVAAGEESGRMETMLHHLGTLYDTELTNALDMVAAAMEPVMLLCIGTMVGAFVISTMLPIMQLVETL